MMRANLAVEIYHHFQDNLPTRLRLFLKRYIDTDRQHWAKMGTRQRILDGTPYSVTLDMQHWHQRWTYIKGHYPEPHITALITKQLKPDSVFIDIGANVGIHTLLAANLVAENGNCIAFEPNPHSFQHLQQHIQMNNLSDIVQLHQVALGDEKGQMRLENCGNASVGSTLRTKNDNSNNACDVEIERADSLLVDIPSSTHGLCKIDVEGFELHVLRGMKNFIEEHPNFNFIIEVTDDWLQSLGGSAQMLFSFLREYGYDAYEVSLPDAELLPLENPAPKRQFDAFFTRNR